MSRTVLDSSKAQWREILETLELAMAILPRGGEEIRWMAVGKDTLIDGNMKGTTPVCGGRMETAKVAEGGHNHLFIYSSIHSAYNIKSRPVLRCPLMRAGVNLLQSCLYLLVKIRQFTTFPGST